MAAAEIKRGVKRKRETSRKEKEEDIPLKLRSKLHHGVKEVKKASKKVKTFETQKLVKKLKDARKSGDEENIKSLEGQLLCLKHIDHDYIGVQALRSKINKDAFVSRNADCQAALLSELPAVKTDSADASPHRAVVESRLLSSKVLAQEVAHVIQSLKAVLGEGEKGGEAAENGGKGDIEGEVEEVEDDRLEEEEAEAEDDDPGASWTGFGDDGAAAESGSGRGDENEDESERDIIEDEGDSDDINDDDDGWESGTVHSQNPDNDQPSSDESSTLQNTVKKARPTPKNSKDSKERPGKAGESTFLPSLAVGYIDGASDSEWSDADADLVDDDPVKKNRRGQRARKAIWEKKYGENANHLKKMRDFGHEGEGEHSTGARGGGTGRGSGRGPGRGGDARGRGRGGSSGSGQGRGGGRPDAGADADYGLPVFSSSGRGRGRGRGGTQQGYGHEPHGDRSTHMHTGASAPVRHQDQGYGDRSRVRASAAAHSGNGGGGGGYGYGSGGGAREESQSLHPSWEAKRRLKEKESAAIVPSQGKRMTFV